VFNLPLKLLESIKWSDHLLLGKKPWLTSPDTVLVVQQFTILRAVCEAETL